MEWLLLVWKGKWSLTSLERDVATGIWRGGTLQVVGWLLLV